MLVPVDLKEQQRGLNLKRAIQAADSFSRSCGVPCRVVDPMGETLHLAVSRPDQARI